MASWEDKGILLKARPYGDAATIVHFLTAKHGRFAGLVRGGTNLKRQLHPGSICDLSWMSRLDDQLGIYQVEVESAVASRVLDDPLRLAALVATMGLLDKTLAEREPANGVFEAASVWLSTLEGEVWAQMLVYLELGLLAHLGYGLRLEACAVTGQQEDLAYVSPKTGAAVSEEGAGPYRDKLLPLPTFLGRRNEGESPSDIQSQEREEARQVVLGLNLTGYFLHHRVFAATNASLPADRINLVSKFEALAEQT